MSMWGWLLLACAAAYAIKLSGYLVPVRILDDRRMTRVAGTLTIGLLASLTAMNTFAGGSQTLVLDARLAALAAAGTALWLRVPFLGVVTAGAAAAALLRATGVG